MAAIEFAHGYCKKCGADRKLTRPGINHVLHLLLSIVTLGIWLVMWLLIAGSKQRWRCDTCGTRKVRRRLLS